jgi:hypothetical protein
MSERSVSSLMSLASSAIITRFGSRHYRRVVEAPEISYTRTPDGSIGDRVGALASSGEVLVSRTVTDLVAGSGIEFDDRGTHSLKGVPGEWQLYAVKDAARGSG